MTRRFLFISFVAVLAGLAVGVWALWPRTAITPENASQIVQGMALAEVETILGGPARDESSGRLAVAEVADEERGEVQLFFWREHTYGAGSREWVSQSLIVRVDFDADARVTAVDCLPVRRVAESPLDMLRRWLGL